MDKTFAEFHGIPFEFNVTAKDEMYYEGSLIWNKEDKKKYRIVEKKYSDDEDTWYLDKDGYRLDDEKLFENSPWAITENGITKKVVRRFFDFSNGKIKFSLGSWFRIGDEYNKRSF
jgi:hypothetical protein